MDRREAHDEADGFAQVLIPVIDSLQRSPGSSLLFSCRRLQASALAEDELVASGQVWPDTDELGGALREDGASVTV